MTKTALINSAWTINNRDEQTPQLSVDYTGVTWVVIINQSVNLPTNPDPNLAVLHIVCDDATATAIEADANYSVLTDVDGVIGFLDVPEGESASQIIKAWLGDDTISTAG